MILPFIAKGDFEITAGYEIIKVDPPIQLMALPSNSIS